ncbi:TPA: hypothetical protein HA231_00085 [Candidatus Woesearchaeota archaeon]|nr:hypothetical protein [Candidatus Woesearchaeota archaeon]
MEDFEKKGLVDRVFSVAKGLGLDGSVADLAERLVNDGQPLLMDAYLFGQTSDNELSEFQAARRMRLDGLASRFWVVDGAAKDGYPGYADWRGKLGPMVGYQNVVPLPIPKRVQESKGLDGRQFGLNVNTLTEAMSLVDMAKGNSVQALYVVSVPFHFLRACVTAMSEAIKGGEDVAMFGYVGSALPWGEIVRHSQGTQVGTREQILRDEMQKLSYPNLLPPARIIRYMEQRRASGTTRVI